MCLYISFFVFITHMIFTWAQQPSLLCGNGRIDPGEECDPSASLFSSECCASSCRFSPVTQSCFGGSGICKLGKCVTRASECSSLDSTVLQFTNPQGAITGLAGPWSSCVISPKNASDVSTLISTNATSGVSMLSKLLPPHLAVQGSCTKVCQGTAVGGSNSSSMCADFSSFSNLSPATSDYMSCLLDNSSNTVLRTLKTSSNVTADYSKLVSPGVCVTGVCRPDLCSSTRCNGRGVCTLSQTVIGALNISLGLSSSTTGDSSLIGTVACKCVSGWSGDQCQYTDPSSNINGTYPDGTTEDTVSRQKYQDAILTSVLCSIAGCIVLFLLLILMTRYCSSRNSDEKQNEFEKAYLQDNRKSVVVPISPVPHAPKPSNGIPELKELPQITPFDELKVGDDVILEERSSSADEASITDKSSVVSETLSAGELDSAEEVKPETVQNEASTTSIITSNPQNVLLPANYLRAAHAYNARLADEINLLPGDILYLIKAYDDGWAKAYNLRSGREGIFPLSFAKRIIVKDASESLISFAKGGVYAGETDDSHTMDDRKSNLEEN